MIARKSIVYRAIPCTLGLLTLSACASTPDPIVGPAVIAPRADLGQAEYDYSRPDSYSLRPSDQISVNVFREPDFSLETVAIGVEGNISLPMLGSVPVAGMTAKELERSLATRLEAAGLRSPMVSVNIVTYASHLVTVEGSVEDPGVYIFQPGSRLSAAIALGGGLSRTAEPDQVAVFREGPEGIKIARFDYGQVRQGTMLDPVLEPNDRIVVGTDGLSVFWQDALQALPVIGIFANVAR